MDSMEKLLNTNNLLHTPAHPCRASRFLEFLVFVSSPTNHWTLTGSLYPLCLSASISLPPRALTFMHICWVLTLLFICVLSDIAGPLELGCRRFPSVPSPAVFNSADTSLLGKNLCFSGGGFVHSPQLCQLAVSLTIWNTRLPFCRSSCSFTAWVHLSILIFLISSDEKFISSLMKFIFSYWLPHRFLSCTFLVSIINRF